MSENKDGNNQMDTDLRKKEEEPDSECGNLSYFTCPVCGELLHKKNLPDMESVIYDNLYHEGGVRIGSLRVWLHCDFEHLYDEEGFTIENPHDLVGYVDTAFDQSGECIKFSLSEVCPAKKKAM